METTCFGGPPEEADALLALVLEGRKTATCWAACHGQRSHVGRRMILVDSQQRPRAIVETVFLERRRYADIDQTWAREEGEGDLSLGHWRRVHCQFFEREGVFTEDMDLWCERFRVVELLAF